MDETPKTRYEMKPPSFFNPELSEQTEKLQEMKEKKKLRPPSGKSRNYATKMRLQKRLAERQAEKEKSQSNIEK